MWAELAKLLEPCQGKASASIPDTLPSDHPLSPLSPPSPPPYYRSGGAGQMAGLEVGPFGKGGGGGGGSWDPVLWALFLCFSLFSSVNIRFQ